MNTVASRWRGAVLSVRLYISGAAPKSQRAVATIEDVCSKLAGIRYELEIVDVLQDPCEALPTGCSSRPRCCASLRPPC